MNRMILLRPRSDRLTKDLPDSFFISEEYLMAEFMRGQRMQKNGVRIIRREAQKQNRVGALVGNYDALFDLRPLGSCFCYCLRPFLPPQFFFEFATARQYCVVVI